MLFQQPDQLCVLRLFREIQAQIAAGLLQPRALRQIAQTGDIQVVAHLPQHLVVAGRPHFVEYDTNHVDTLAEVGKPLQQRCHGVGCTPSVDHQHNGQAQHLRNLCRRAPVTVVAVVESHHAFHNRHIGIAAIAAEQLADMLGRGHERVEVNAWPAAHCLVELRVDVVWPALERLHRQPLLRQHCHQPPGNRCLARAAGWCRNHQSLFHRCKGTTISQNTQTFMFKHFR